MLDHPTQPRIIASHVQAIDSRVNTCTTGGKCIDKLAFHPAIGHQYGRARIICITSRPESK